MIQYVTRRVLLAIPTLLLMLTVIFVLVRLVPGDAAIAILGDQASAESLAAMRAQLGLDQPIHIQYLDFLAKAVTGDFGAHYLQDAASCRKWRSSCPIRLN